MGFDQRNVPIFIVCRDKVSPLAELVGWLEVHRYERIVLVDNASTYPPLLDYFDRTPHEVVRLADNVGPHASIWKTGVRDNYAAGSHYVVTDCDVVPDPGCPGDAVDFFHWSLCRFPSFVKAGFGLRIDDLPEHYGLAKRVRQWEGRFWSQRFARNLYNASIDTTFALYRPDSKFAFGPSIRSGKPYLARHQPWYADSANPTEEDRYYRDHCDPQISHWDLDGHEPRVESPSLEARLRWRAHVLWRMRRDPAVTRRHRPVRPTA